MAGVMQARDGAVGILTLDEPASLNAMTPDLLGALAVAVADMTKDPDVRALILTGEGRGFCSGQNLKASEALGEDIAAGVMRFYWPAFKALRECRVPVVVAVNGVAAGGGFSLAMAGDIIVAARSASFIQVFSRIALVPDLGSTWLLPRLVGLPAALDLLCSARKFRAPEALELGLVNRVIPDDKLMAETRAYATLLANTVSPRSVAVMKRQLWEAQFQTLAESTTQANHEMELSFQTADFKEGVAHYLEKRAARFTGK